MISFTARFTRHERLRVQRLYLVDGISPKEIADDTGYTARQISDLAHRKGWTKIRKQQEIEINRTTAAISAYSGTPINAIEWKEIS